MTLQETIADLTAKRADRIARNLVLDNLIISEQASYNDWAAHNNYTEAHKHSDLVAVYDGERTANKSLIDSYTNSINSLNAQQNANTALVNQQASLTPAQLVDLQKTKTAADAATAQAQIYAQSNTKYLIIAGVVITFIAVGFLIYKKVMR